MSTSQPIHQSNLLLIPVIDLLIRCTFIMMRCLHFLLLSSISLTLAMPHPAGNDLTNSIDTEDILNEDLSNGQGQSSIASKPEDQPNIAMVNPESNLAAGSETPAGPDSVDNIAIGNPINNSS